MTDSPDTPTDAFVAEKQPNTSYWAVYQRGHPVPVAVFDSDVMDCAQAHAEDLAEELNRD